MKNDKKHGLESFQWNYKNEIRKPLRQGSLVLSQPFLNDSVFKRAVCFLCAHTRKEGSFGFIINKISDYKLSDFLANVETIDDPIYYGGPVATDTLYFLHDNALDITDAQKITQSIYWGGNFDEFIQKYKEVDSNTVKVKFFIGYAGWEQGQLRKEIIEDSWIVTKNKYDVFGNTEDAWKLIMEDMGDVYQHLSQLPESPTLN